jgi:Domain of unknown function (DUF4276)
VSGAIYLIVEDRTDVDVVRALLQAKNIMVEIKPLYSPKGGLSRLAKALELLIRTALKQRKSGDCIAILHDADEQIQPNRQLYKQIQAICKKYSQDVVLIIAQDEIEAWMLADEGLCHWLGEKPRNCDTEKRPSDRLKRVVKEKTQRSYSGAIRTQVLQKLDGSGDKYSPSMQAALEHLMNAPCVT